MNHAIARTAAAVRRVRSRRAGRIFLSCLAVASALWATDLLTACGSGSGGGGGTATPPVQMTAKLQGRVVDASVAGSQVSAYTITSTGSPGTLIAGPVTSASDGSYTLDLGSYSGPVIVESTGGTYTDPVTGAAINLAASGLTMMAIVPSVTPSAGGNTVSAQITPLTTIAAQMELTLLGQSPGADIATTAAAMNAEVGQFFGQSDLLTTALLDLTTAGCSAGASQASIDESLILNGFAQLANNAGVTEPNLVQALAADASDGIFNGYNGATQITVPLIAGGTVLLSTLENGTTAAGNPGALAALETSIAEFQASPGNACQAAASAGVATLANPSVPLGHYGNFTVYLNVSLPAGTTASVMIGFQLGNVVEWQETTGPLSNGQTSVLVAWPYADWEIITSDVSSTSWVAQVIGPSSETCSVTPSSGVYATISNLGINTSTTPLQVSCTGAAAPVTSVSVVPAAPNPLTIGQGQSFRALATLSGGTIQDITGSATWTSSNTAQVSVQTAGGAQPGLATALAVTGSPVTIRAMDPNSGFLGNATISVVEGSALSSVIVLPFTSAAPSVAINAHQQFTAFGAFLDGSYQNITSAATWTSSDPTTVTILSGGLEPGLATGLAVTANPDTITASYTAGGVTANGTSQLSVTALPPPSCYPAGAGGGTAPYINESYCATFTGETDGLYTFNGTLAFTTTSSFLIGGCQFWSTSAAGSAVSGSTQTTCTGVINTGTSITCGINTYAPPNFQVQDNLTNTFCGTFAPSGATVAGTYSFGEFGPGGGVASGSFTGTRQ